MKFVIKTSLLIIVFSFASVTLLQAQPKIAALSSSGWTQDPEVLGFMVPYTDYSFRVDYTPLAGTTLSKVDWYYGVTFLKTEIGTNQTTINIPFYGSDPNVNVNAVVTYSNSSTQTTNKFNFLPKVLAVQISSNSLTFTPGCLSSTTFTTSTYDPPRALKDAYYKPSSYNVTYIVPADWTVQKNTSDGHSTTITTDSASADITARIILPCGYYEDKKITVNTLHPNPAFAASNNYTFCSSSSKTLAINSVCGASSYTYTLSGNSNPKFSNNSQTIITNNTSASITVSTLGYQATLSVKANFPDNTSSINTSTTIFAGAPQASLTKQQYACSSGGAYQTWLLSVNEPSYGTNWKWTDYDPNNYKSISSPNSSSTYVDLYANGGTVLLTYTDRCGATQTVPVGIYKYCPPSFAVIPNPSKNYIVVSDKSLNNTVNGRIQAIRITDRMGDVRKTFEYKSFIKSVRIAVSDLKSGVYLLSIYDGHEWNTQSLIVQ